MYNTVIEAVLTVVTLNAMCYKMNMWQWWVGMVCMNVLFVILRKSAQHSVHPTNGGQS